MDDKKNEMKMIILVHSLVKFQAGYVYPTAAIYSLWSAYQRAVLSVRTMPGIFDGRGVAVENLPTRPSEVGYKEKLLLQAQEPKQ